MYKKILHNISKISGLAMTSSILMTGCSFLPSAEIANVSDEIIKEDLKNTLNENGYRVDEVTSMTYEMGSFSDEEKETIGAQFTSKTTVRKHRCKFTSTSIERGINGVYDLVYAYVDGEWVLITSAPYEENTWIYTPKDTVSTKQIRDDLQTIEIPDLNGALIGAENDTEIEISNRQSDIENGKDSMTVSVTYDAKFAVYKFDIQLQYQFKNGKWVMTSNSVDEQEFWNITFDEETKPNEPKESYIIDEISNSANYKNYMMNLSYVDNHYLTKGSETIKGNELTYNYVLIITYDEFCDIEYNIDKKYVWENNAWQEGDLLITVKSADWSKMIGTWASTNGDFLRVKDTEKGNITGTYTHKYEDGEYVTYSVKGKVDIELKDNDWDFIIEQGDIEAGNEEEHFVILPFRLNFKDDTITSNGNIYIAKGDEDGGAAFHTGDNSYYEDKPEEDLTPEHDDNYDSGLTFFDEGEPTEDTSESKDGEDTGSEENEAGTDETDETDTDAQKEDSEAAEDKTDSEKDN